MSHRDSRHVPQRDRILDVLSDKVETIPILTQRQVQIIEKIQQTVEANRCAQTVPTNQKIQKTVEILQSLGIQKSRRQRKFQHVSQFEVV